MRKKSKDQKKRDIYALEQINLNAAGADIGASEIYVAVPPDRDEESVRSFLTFTADLYQLADWLANCGIETIAMESTGVYWIPLYEILESRGFEVCLVNAQHLKNVRGRKSDVMDCQWIQQLHTYGLLSASFRPPEDICAIRSLVRHRDMLIRYRSAHIQHMQKALHLMNIQLTIVLSDITGVTGQKIIRAIVAGERNPKVLASFRHNKCSHSETDIEKSLEGNYKFEHVFALKQALELYDFYDQLLQTCDAELEKLYQAFEPVEDPGTQAPSPRRGKRRKNEPYFDLSQSLYRITGVDLVRIDGLDAVSVQKIISEVGLDMNKWPTVKHFTSWLRLSPNNLVTGGKTKRRGTQPTQNRANAAFRMGALSLARSNSALGGFYRRMNARKGAPKAITATAHKLARIFYCMLKYRREYCDPGFDYYERQYQERVIRNLRRKAAQLGYSLEPKSATQSLPTTPVPL